MVDRRSPLRFLCTFIHLPHKATYNGGFFFAMLPSMSEIPTTEPTEITAGDTIKWTKSLDDYPADEFVLKYQIVPLSGGAPITVTASADGTDHSVSISAATSAGYTSGDYRWFSYATDIATGLERYTIDHADLTIKPDPTATTAADLRSHARTTLDAIEALLEGEASIAQQEMTIEGKSLKRRTIAELLEMRSFYLAEVQREEKAEAIRKGLGTGGRILTRFS